MGWDGAGWGGGHMISLVEMRPLGWGGMGGVGCEGWDARGCAVGGWGGVGWGAAGWGGAGRGGDRGDDRFARDVRGDAKWGGVAWANDCAREDEQ